MPGVINKMINGNPNKPDYTEGEDKKKGLGLFFTVLGVHFWDLIKLNLLFLVFILPFAAWTMYNAGVIITMQPSSGTMDNQFVIDIANAIQFYLLGCVPCLMFAGPPLGALTYVTKRWAEDEHVFLWSDFKDALKQNWKQSGIVMLVFGLVIALGNYGMNFYGQYAEKGMIFTILKVGLAVLMFLFLSSYIYIMPMLCTYDLKLGAIFKNGMLIAVAKLPLTLLFALLTLLPMVIGGVIAYFTPYAVIGIMAYYAFFGCAFAAFVNNSMTNPVFAKIFNTDEAAQEGADGKGK